MGRCDRISELPDALISQILLLLPTKYSIRTSVLSKRWRNLWLYVPGLDLHSNDFDGYTKSAIKNFTDRFLELNRESSLQKFKIKYDLCNVYLSAIGEWFATVINRGVQHLDVDTVGIYGTKDFIPLEVYKSKTIVSIKLANVGMLNPDFVVSLPCLKIMHLEDILYKEANPSVIEKLISGCPVLEDLTVCRVLDDKVPVLRMKSQSLKRLSVRSATVMSSFSDEEHAIEIDAPELEYMDFRDNQSARIVMKNLSSLFKVDIDVRFISDLEEILVSEYEIILAFLTGVSSVRHMIISHRALEPIIHVYMEVGLMTKFHNLSRLEASCCVLLLQMLPDFLESCPNLKHLTLYLVYLKELEPENLELTNVPQCLLSTLECIEIKEVITEEDNEEEITRSSTERAVLVANHKKRVWMRLVRYIIEKSVILKKLRLCFSPMTNQVLDISKELPTFEKRSRRCQIIIN